MGLQGPAVAETRVNLANSNRSVRHPDGHVEPSALADARELGKLPEEVMNLALPKPAETIWAKVPNNRFPRSARHAPRLCGTRHPVATFDEKGHLQKMISRDLV